MRALSSVLVVVLGIVPAALGTGGFALFIAILGVLGWHEYGRLMSAAKLPLITSSLILGSFSIPIFALAALARLGTIGVLAAFAIAVYGPLAIQLMSRGLGPFGLFQSISFGVLYLGIPVYSAVVLRQMPGESQQGWFTDLAQGLARFGEAAPWGLATVLTVVLAVWLSDTAAYLAGSAFGRHKLAPHISPGKSIEGSLAGLLAATAMGAVAFSACGAGSWQDGAILGAVSGAMGQVGDLGESLMKRQAGVKDSGTLIPGHGGILDRIDALLFAFPAALLTVHALNWLNR